MDAIAMLLWAGCLSVETGRYEKTGDETSGPLESPANLTFGGVEQLPLEPPCPPYPEAPAAGYGFEAGDVVRDFYLPGAAPDEEVEGEIGLGDFWCWAHRRERPRTVLVLNVHSCT